MAEYKLSFTAEEIDEKLKEVKTTDQTYKPESENAQSGKAVAEAVSHEKYFEIVDEYFSATKSRRAIVLKPQYRGATVDFSQDSTIIENIGQYYTTACTVNSASDNGIGEVGSKINELPEVLYIPETIKGETYKKIGSGTFAYNKKIKEVFLPKSIQTIPSESFAYTQNLERLLNTEHVTGADFGAFFASSIKEIDFPNFQYWGASKAFMKCGHLKKINIGKVANIPDRSFEHCTDLQEIIHDTSVNITTVGNYNCW